GLAGTRTAMWSAPSQAQGFVNEVRPELSAQIQLLDAHGNLLAPRSSSDADQVGRAVSVDGLSDVLAGAILVHTSYNQGVDAELVDALVPIIGPDGRAVGVIRLTHRLATVYSQFVRLRQVIAEILGAALVLGAGIGLVLALNLERPLREMTTAIQHLASGRELTPLPERGTNEVRVLLHAFNTLAERLRTVEDARRQLLANLVHELGTPLGALNSGVEALRGGAEEQVALRQELLAGMQSEIGHLRRLLDDLARLSDQLLGGSRLHFQSIDLSEWLAGLLVTWRQAAQAKGLKWNVQISPLLPAVQADPDRLAQVIGNLLSNAIKYTRAGGSITVAAAAEAGRVRIAVEDSGAGIPADEQALIFNPFFRGRAGGRFAEGMGLGLTIAQDLAQAHGGRLEVASTVGQGSRFTVWLPVASA
ncbi:MAG: HAMP domain-containing histidine kinase, partial [Chloroflexi bacterium]|nr:HAMP domain-containing histidine kinase [Chloroflexota bacterium]